MLEKTCQAADSRVNEIEIILNEQCQNLRDFCEERFVDINRRLAEHGVKMEGNTMKLLRNQEKIESNESEIDELKSRVTSLKINLDKTMVRCEEMSLNKADEKNFAAFIELTNKRLGDSDQYSQLSRNMVIGCHNYIDKYLPLFLIRNVKEMVDAVQHDLKVRYKLKKYCTAKEDMLMESILDDDGSADLANNVS
jgi:hypothetical protein